jgi:hypothetical protein
VTLVEMIHTIEDVPHRSVVRARHTNTGYSITVRNTETGLEKALSVPSTALPERLTFLAKRLGQRA